LKATENPGSGLHTVRVPDKLVPLFREAQHYVAQYFADQRSAPERGTLEISGQRYMLVRAASMSVEFHDMVKSFYAEEQEATAVAHALLFDVAHAMGLADAKAFAERMQVHDPIARLSAGPVQFAYAGWAFVDISPESSPSPDEHYYLLYDHPYSFESDSWLAAQKPSTRAVCVMNAGYSSGWCEDAFGLPLVAAEILCRAKGDATCRFIMAPPERIGAHIARYAAEHPELADRIVNYQVPDFFSKRTDRQLLRKNLELEQDAERRARELASVNERLRRDILERERTQADLRASQELNERLIEALPGGIVHVAKDGAILRANAEACRILGLKLDELSRRYTSDFASESIFEDGSPAAVADYPVTRALVTGEIQPAKTIGIRRPDGEVAWAVFRAVPTRDPATQSINGAVVTFLDITERKRFEEKLRQTQKLESLGVLAGGIAHDFNNLLVAILGNASLGKNVSEADPRIQPLFEEIELGARRAAELTKRMLDYAGRGRATPEEVDLSAMVREMAKLLRPIIPKHVEIHYQFQEGIPTFEADAPQLRQVVMNLITNAAEAMAERPGRLMISIQARRFDAADLEAYLGDPHPGVFVVLDVSDSGCGMDEATRAKIFDPFFTTKFKGRGLGMATVLGIVSGHRGAIRIESREGMGTRASVLLPVKFDRASSIPVTGDGNRGTILVVDDDNGVRTMVRRCLAVAGYRTLQAADGAEGVQLFERHKDEVLLVVMDVDMPGMNGFEAVDRIRALAPDARILMSSGYRVEPAEIERRRLSGLLEKPYDVERLLRGVEHALAGVPKL
jgi:two-component system, cell cycle sensor histidine kinase and response regulator CckA